MTSYPAPSTTETRRSDYTTILPSGCRARIQPEMQDHCSLGHKNLPPKRTQDSNHPSKRYLPSRQVGRGPTRLKVDEIVSFPVSVEQVIRKSRVEFWVRNGVWPIVQEEKIMNRYRSLQWSERVRKTPLRRKRSDTGSNAEMALTWTSSREQCSYQHAQYESELKELGSFMERYREISTKSKELFERLLRSPQSPPRDTLFEDDFFEDTLESIKGRSEAKVIRVITELIWPSAENRAFRGAKHLKIIRETANTIWHKCIPFHGPTPQPDYSLGFKREAFTTEQRKKLQTYFENGTSGCSSFAATYDMYFPCVTGEVKCGAAALDVADRQNAHSQTVQMRGLFNLFRSVGRENELHNTVSGFSFSHSDVDVRLWAHFIRVNKDIAEYYREPIAKFNIEKTPHADYRWTGWTVAMNVFDLWVPNQFQLICSAIDMLPASLDFEVSEQSEHQYLHSNQQSPRPRSPEQPEGHEWPDEGGVQLSTLSSIIQVYPPNPSKQGRHIFWPKSRG